MDTSIAVTAVERGRVRQRAARTRHAGADRHDIGAIVVSVSIGVTDIQRKALIDHSVAVIVDTVAAFRRARVAVAVAVIAIVV